MRLRNQDWQETEKFIQLKLHQPMWSAWQRFGWEKGVEGIGVAREAAKYAWLNKKNIRVVMGKYGIYEITPKKLEELYLKYNSKYLARDQKVIYVTPRTGWKNVKEDKNEHS